MVIGAAVALLAGVIVAVVIGGRDSPNAAQQGAIQGASTTTVERRSLLETDIETGTLGYCGELNVYGRLAGTVTWVPSAGTVVYPDHALYGVEGKGVYLLDGTQPARRAFHAGMSDGADVRQLNRGLRSMGYDPNREIGLNEHFSEATKAAVKRWQQAHGLKQTGKIEFGRVVFQPGPRRVEKVSLALGGSATPSAAPSSTEAAAGVGAACARPARNAANATAAYTESQSPRAMDAVYTGGGSAIQASSTAATPATTGPRAPAPNAPTTGSTSPTPSPSNAAPTPTTPSSGAPPAGKPKPPGHPGGSAKGTQPAAKPGSGPSEPGTNGQTAQPGAGTATKPTARTPSSGASAPSASATAGGAQSPAPGVALVTTSLQRVVTVALEAAKQSEARAGEAVHVTLPSGELVSGHIAGVAGAAATVPSNSSGSSSGSSSSTVDVEIALDKHLAAAALDQAPVSVAFAAQRQKNALAIPVSALVATAGGGYAVEEVRGATRALTPVTPGLYAGGYVAITGVPEGTVITSASR